MQFPHTPSRAPLHTYCWYFPAGHAAEQFVQRASATALWPTQVCVMYWPAGQLSVQFPHTVSTYGVHGAAVYCQARHDRHARQLYTPVRVQFVPSATVPFGQTIGHRAHRASAVAVHGLTV